MKATQLRTEIRKEVAQRIRDQIGESYPELVVFTSQRNDVDPQVQHYINVHFVKGDISLEGSYRNDDARLAVRVTTTYAEDPDSLMDEVIDQIEDLLQADLNIDQTNIQLTPDQWAQGEHEANGGSWLAQLYRVTYSTPI